MEAVVSWLTDHGAPFFDFIQLIFGTVIDAFTGALLFVPPLLLLGLITAVSYFLHRSWLLSLFVALTLLLILNLQYWQPMVETLSLVVSATVFCVIVGVPVGVA